MSDTPLLIAGLGNPGAEHVRDRHNAGFIIADALHEAYRFGPWRAKFDGLLAEGSIGGRRIYLLKPQTYMNLSGRSVGAAMRFYKLTHNAIVVIHDEIDLAAGKLKAKTGGGDAGNNGLRSITAAIGPDYRRVRVGVGKASGKAGVIGHVLGSFSRSDMEWFQPMVEAIVDAAPMLAKDDDIAFLNKVQLKINPQPKKTKPDEKEKD
jgi:PTH1 family peptidyl-tRNA hydrolase